MLQTSGGVAVQKKTAEKKATEKLAVEMKVVERADETQTVAGMAAAKADFENNRREQTRYSCRLGAEVYRTGSSVPNYCCLTDLSSGGCYLEVHLPFPKDSSVEIIIRTHELKLRLRGKVQASHPGYGMGIAFELKTKEERDQVKQLTDFVESTQPQQ